MVIFKWVTVSLIAISLYMDLKLEYWSTLSVINVCALAVILASDPR